MRPAAPSPAPDRPRQSGNGRQWRNWAALPIILTLAFALTAFALSTPPPRPASAPAAAFSAARAFPDIAAIARRPHPIGSAQGARVRAYLVQRLSGLGLQPSVRPGPVANIAAVLPGTDPALPAVVLMSHYDSVPSGPGAADDGAGVAAALEIVRALKAAGPHRRDVIVLITDGEEAGLRGARAFFGGDPLAARAGVVLNMEARGNGGRAVMFETRKDSGALVAFLVRAGALRGASSLMPDLYRRLPNDTDLTVALNTGLAGLNFAFFGGQAAYHTALDTPGRLDLGSVQHMGDQVLAAAAVLADAPALPAPAPDLVYGDILGGPIVAYAPWKGWVILAMAAVLAALGLSRSEARLADVGRGALGFVSLAVVETLVLAAAGLALGALWRFPDLLTRYLLVFTGQALLAGGTALLVLGALARAGVSTPDGLGFGALAVGLLGAAAVQAVAPADAFILAWPVLAAAAIAAVRALRRPWSPFLAGAVAALAVAQVAYWAGLMFALIGVALPAMLAIFVALAVIVLAPWAARGGPIPAASRPGRFARPKPGD